MRLVLLCSFMRSVFPCRRLPAALLTAAVGGQRAIQSKFKEWLVLSGNLRQVCARARASA